MDEFLLRQQKNAAQFSGGMDANGEEPSWTNSYSGNRRTQLNLVAAWTTANTCAWMHVGRAMQDAIAEERTFMDEFFHLVLVH
jgi:hypothetical protein